MAVVSLCFDKPFLGWGIYFFLFFLIPVFIHRKNKEFLSESGLGLPRFNDESLAWFIVGALVMAASAVWAGARPDFQAEYPLCRVALYSLLDAGGYYLSYFLFYTAWEFFFRGYVQLYWGRRLGILRMMAFQVALSTLLHWGKPWPGFFGAFPGGIFFGLLSIWTRSVWPAVFLHTELGFLTDFFCLR